MTQQPGVLCYADLDESTTDRCWKLWPLYGMLLSRFQNNTILTTCLCVDESMVQYFGKSGNALKQRMPMKPIRSGNKVWSLNVDNEYNIITYIFKCALLLCNISSGNYFI